MTGVTPSPAAENEGEHCACMVGHKYARPAEPYAGDVEAKPWATDLHAVTLIRDVAGIDGRLALTVWNALAPLLGHIEREARDDERRKAAALLDRERREARVGALREAADRWETACTRNHPLDAEVADRIVPWLRDRADRIEATP